MTENINYEDKSFSLVEYQMGEDLNSRIVLLETELIETQKIIRNQTAKALKEIAANNRIFLNSIAGKPIHTPDDSSLHLSISNIHLWTALGYLKDATIASFLDAIATTGTDEAPNIVTTYIGIEVYEKIITSSDDSSIIDDRTQIETARRRKIYSRMLISDTGNFVTNPDADTDLEYGNIAISLGNIVRKYAPSTGETWTDINLEYENDFARGNVISFTDLATGDVFLPTEVEEIKFARMTRENVEDFPTIFQVYTTRYLDDTVDSPDYNVDKLIVPADNFDYSADDKTMTLKFPSTFVFKEGYTNASTGQVGTLEVPHQSYRTNGTNIDGTNIVIFDPVLPEKASIYNSLLSQGNNFLFTRYSALFFIPADNDPDLNDLIDEDSTADIYISSSNGAAFLDTDTKLEVITKNMITQNGADLTGFMILYDAEVDSGTLAFEYSLSSGGSWVSASPNVVIEGLSSSADYMRLRITLNGGVGATAKLRSLALFHNPESSANIIRKDTANWQEVVSISNDNHTAVFENAYTPFLNPPQLDVFLRADSSDSGWTKLVRAEPGELDESDSGTYQEVDSNTIFLNFAAPDSLVMARPIASAIDTNDYNRENIEDLTTRMDTLEATTIAFSKGSDNLGVYRKVNFASNTSNFDVSAEGLGTSTIKYKFSYSNGITTTAGANNAATGSAFIYKTINFSVPWGTDSGVAVNADVGTLPGLTWTVAQSAEGATTNITFRNTFYRQVLSNLTFSTRGIPRTIDFDRGISCGLMDSNGLMTIGLNYTKGLEIATGESSLKVRFTPNKGLVFDNGNGTDALSFLVKTDSLLSQGASGLATNVKLGSGTVTVSTPTDPTYINASKMWLTKYVGTVNASTKVAAVIGMKFDDEPTVHGTHVLPSVYFTDAALGFTNRPTAWFIDNGSLNDLTCYMANLPNLWVSDIKALLTAYDDATVLGASPAVDNPPTKIVVDLAFTTVTLRTGLLEGEVESLNTRLDDLADYLNSDNWASAIGYTVTILAAK